MDMELELRALRSQLMEKSKHSLRLQKEVCLLFYTTFPGFSITFISFSSIFGPMYIYICLVYWWHMFFSCIIWMRSIQTWFYLCCYSPLISYRFKFYLSYMYSLNILFCFGLLYYLVYLSMYPISVFEWSGFRVFWVL